MHISLDDALALATKAHEGQTRRHGAPYIAHPMAVRQLVDDLAYAVELAIDERARAIALLHDVVEDSDFTASDLAARFGDDVARGVELLTKTGKGAEATRAYYERLSSEADDVVRLVKIADRVHNLSELHLDADPAKLAKYVTETLAHLVPLALSAHDRAVGAGLAAALHDGIRAASQAQRAAVPPAARHESRVPAGLYAIVDRADRLRDLVEGGVAVVQLRNKTAGDDALVAMARAMAAACPAGVPLIVNDRADLASRAGAGGVHVGTGDMPPVDARALVGFDAFVGASSHTDAQLAAVCNDAVDASGARRGADHVAVGPVFASPTKAGHAEIVGLDALAARVRASSLPVVAIGGITSPARAAQAGRAGAHLVAAVSALDVAEARVVARRMSASFFAARASARARDPSPGGAP